MLEKVPYGESFAYTDEYSGNCEARINTTGQLKSNVVGGSLELDSLAALLQIAPALYGKVYGFSQEGLQIVAQRFDMGPTSLWAKAIVKDNRLFEDFMQTLVFQEWVRVVPERCEIYFPSELYMRSCGLLKA